MHQQPIDGLTGIHLVRAQDAVEVRIEIDGRWVTVIREHADGPFSHIVEPSGIRAAVADRKSSP